MATETAAQTGLRFVARISGSGYAGRRLTVPIPLPAIEAMELEKGGIVEVELKKLR